MFADREFVSTEALTTSFGWSKNDERVQHDVQELSRKLFDAMELSLVGTRGETIIRDLYLGTTANIIKCLQCNKVSERREEFRDLSIPVIGHFNLQAR